MELIWLIIIDCIALVAVLALAIAFAIMYIIAKQECREIYSGRKTSNKGEYIC